MSMILDGSNGVTFNDASLQGAAASPYVLKNRIINGAMVIDQRNAGASVTPTNAQYLVDRWTSSVSAASKWSAQQSSTAPTGFNTSLLITSLSAYSVGSGDVFGVYQQIEGFNTADLSFGTANAKTITISFWVRSSLTGTFSGSLLNATANRSYPFTYTISVANTWEQKSVTITGDTSGTWQGATNAVGLTVYFNLGVGSTYGSGTANTWSSTSTYGTSSSTSVVGTNGATFYITGVQLEVGTSATPFERRLYGQELINCQRYCVVYGREATYNEISGTGFAISSTTVDLPVILSPQMRTIPSISSSGNFQLSDGAAATVITSFQIASPQSSSLVLSLRANVSSGLTTFRPYRIESANSAASTLTISAEL